MKSLLTCILMMLSICAIAQDDERKNEFKVNAAYLLGGYPEIAYERILSEETAYGISLGFDLEGASEYIFSVLPYYRLYFGKKRQASGFFIEGSGAIYGEEYYYYSGPNYDESRETGIGLGIGLAIGGKFTTESGWVGELIAGGGRNFLNNDEQPLGFPRFGLLIGKRF